MERNIMELPLPPEQKQLAKIEALADKARAVQDIIKEYENNLLITADLQCEIVTELEKGNIDISLLKAVKAIALMTKNMECYREYLKLIIPRLKASLENSGQDADKYKHYIMLAEQELSDL